MHEEIKMKKLHELQVFPDFAQQHIMNLFLPTIHNSMQKRNSLFGTTLSLTFHQAARDGQYDIVKKYINLYGKDKKKINNKDDEQTSALHYAVRYGHISIVKLLVENGANVNIKGEYNASPLHYASRYIIENKKPQSFKPEVEKEITPSKKYNLHFKINKLSSTSNTSIFKSAKIAFKNSKKKLQNLSSSTQNKIVLNNSSEICSSLPCSSKMDVEQADKNPFKLNKDLDHGKYHCNTYEHIETKSKMKVVMIHDELTQSELVFIKNVDALILPSVKISASSEILVKSISLRDKLNEIGVEKSIHFLDELFKENNSNKEESKNLTIQDTFKEDSILKYLLDQKPDINARDFYESTPLHYAVMRGNKYATELLLAQKNVNFEAIDQSRMTPLHCAALFGSYDICSLLLKRGSNILCREKENMTPLHFAAREGHFNIVKLFLDHATKQGGVPMLAKLLYSCDQDEQTAFHLAVEKNHIEIVDLFIKNNCKVNSTNINMISPLHVACTSGFIELVKLLVDNGAIVESKNLLKETPLHRAAMFNRVEIIDYLLSKGAQIDCRDKDNETPLLMAVRKNNVEAVKVLLDWFADITVKDLNDKTCMFIAAEANCKDVFEILCQYGAQILIEDFDKYEMTPLHIAAKEGHEVIVQALLNLGAKIDAKSEENLTPLHLAAKYGRCRVVEILLSIVSSIVKDVDISSNTPLHLAAIEGHVAVVDMLIKSGAAVDVRNSGNWTPLDCAAFHGWTNCVQSLLNADSLVNPIEKEMVSPLQLACKKGHVDVVKLLLSRNADVSWKDHLGRNCLDYAIDSKQRETAITIISNNNWKMALHNTTFEGNELTTPMRKMIKKLPDVAEQVFNQCIKGNGLPADHPEYKVTYCFELLEDLFCSWGPNSLKFSENKQHENNDLPASKSSLGEQFIKKVKNNLGFKNINAEPNHTLEVMIKHHRDRLLCHPLVTYLLRSKWRLCGRYIYYFRLLLYLLFLFYVTSYALVLRVDEHQNLCKSHSIMISNCSKNLAGFNSNCPILNNSLNFLIPTTDLHCLNDATDIISSCSTLSVDLNSTCLINVTQCCCCSQNFPPSLKYFIDPGRKIALGLTALCLAIELLKLLYEVNHYFRIEKTIELAAYICSIVYTHKPYTWESNDLSSIRCSGIYDSLGGPTITLSWLVLVMFLRQFPKLGIYVVMFTTVFKSFLLFSVLGFLLAVCFGLALHLLLYQESPNSFHTPSRSILKAVMGMLGEYNYDNYFNSINHPVKPLNVTWLIYYVYVFVACLAMTKFLIALAVDDIVGVQKQAFLNKLIMLVDLTLNVEKALPVSIRRKLVKTEESIYPNMQKTWSFWSFWSVEENISSDKKGDLKIINNEHTRLKEKVYSLRTRMKAMEAQNNRIETKLNFVVKRLAVNK
ncbi:transient receptor potential cation channel subfamily A member 1 isoform X1 [Hydra vulgaris]|uniref:transient receptor potential cation channel subfamily A member 1 isoform X1 n=2 Tax=Hydra vulgaris TaxID=6087 RepID=UPI001F5E8BED|nr:transient receptor potential cation channel subfamily A member 1-like [Hydra vulgaris]